MKNVFTEKSAKKNPHALNAVYIGNLLMPLQLHDFILGEENVKNIQFYTIETKDPGKNTQKKP